MKGPRYDEATRLKTDAERQRRERESSFEAIKNGLLRHQGEAFQHANPVERVQHLLAQYGTTGADSKPLVAKVGDRCPKCSTPTRHRQMTLVEAAAVDLSLLPSGMAQGPHAERWSAAGRVCPDPNCGSIFLEIVIHPSIVRKS